VIKLYKSVAPDHDGVARDEFESLTRLNARLDGSIIDGWSIHTPIPLFRCEQPAGVVMTRVPGRSLNSYLRGAGGANPEVLESLARAVVAALGRYWEGDRRLYGDIDFNNILCEPATRSLSFVDPGMPEGDYLCEGVTKLWYPASRDLAYMLFEVAVSVRSCLGNRAARRRQKELIERMLRTFAAQIGPAHARICLLDEVHACTRIHLRRIRASWSLAGAWRLLLRQIASRSIDQTMQTLKAAAAEGMPCDEAA
jgi:hypothetical protein